MIIADFFKKQNKYVGFQIEGHAGYAESGNDIVCASVSSAIQLVSNTITECFKINANVDVLDGKIQLQLPYSDANAEKMIEGLFLHLKLLSEDYKGTIKITISEV